MNLPAPACPYGYTTTQLRNILGDRFDAFNQWMRGQTVMLCQGMSWHHDRVHDEQCMKPSTMFPDEPVHTEDSPFTWRCKYLGTGHSEPDECADNPHGVVVYRVDLETFLAGREPLD